MLDFVSLQVFSEPLEEHKSLNLPAWLSPAVIWRLFWGFSTLILEGCWVSGHPSWSFSCQTFWGQNLGRSRVGTFIIGEGWKE